MALGIDLQMCLRTTRLGKRILQKQEDRIARYGDWAHVVVAGHTHRPAVREVGDRTYINTGDWLERTHRSFLRIDDDGEFELTTLED
jgi:UDP-2,3-diacylglucosamine pyrophosphatase LpxH